MKIGPPTLLFTIKTQNILKKEASLMGYKKFVTITTNMMKVK